MTETLLFSRRNHIGLVTLNRPSALNALNAPMIWGLQHQLQAWQEDDAIHAVVVCSASDRAFCAGGDVRSIYALRHDHRQQMDFFHSEYRLNQLIHDFEKPYIAMMDGITMGGGVGISLHGSHSVASERFSFAMPETGIGFYPDIGASYLLSKCPGYFGVYLGLTGSRLGPMAARALGLVKYVIPSGQFSTVLEALVEANLSTDAGAQVSCVLEAFTQPAQTPELDVVQPKVDACFQYDHLESIMATLAAGHDEWHQETLRVLTQRAPLSLKVTLAQLQKASTMRMIECLEIDHRLTGHFLRDSDFYEGVRALLVDKDNAPHWNPATLEQVTPARVSDYFS